MAVYIWEMTRVELLGFGNNFKASLHIAVKPFLFSSDILYV
jgi:hypothetical protein